MIKKIAIIISTFILLAQPLKADEPNLDKLVEKLNIFVKCINDEIKDTKEYQINQWTDIKKQKIKELKIVQHKLTGFFSDFPLNEEENK